MMMKNNGLLLLKKKVLHSCGVVSSLLLLLFWLALRAFLRSSKSFAVSGSGRLKPARVGEKDEAFVCLEPRRVLLAIGACVGLVLPTRRTSIMSFRARKTVGWSLCTSVKTPSDWTAATVALIGFEAIGRPSAESTGVL